ncbi:tryptophan aminotransferase-related protein 4-like [Bidens hawaiensis]|uniref:tryptophan aminotransferase-related protein 4-like n=1 Tax=Bidens hawaiensis TaxID=980011 RepID=UPI00404A692D
MFPHFIVHLKQEIPNCSTMSKSKNYGFLISIAVNILLISIGIYLYAGGGRWAEKNLQIGHLQSTPPLGWSSKAALEAEIVAAMPCSGHGRAYVDGSGCECNGCYVGDDCSILNVTCPADAHGGDCMYLEPYWIENAVDTAVLISGWHRMSYNYADGSMISSELEYYIRKLHHIVGNAVTEGRRLVFGVGSAQLLSGAVYALSSKEASIPSNVLATAPYYWLFRDQTSFFDAKNFTFKGNTSAWHSNNTNLVEFVTSPNNPDGGLKESVFHKKKVNDHVFYWPQFSPIPKAADEDIMIFSLSKLTGHAGSRFGWAIVKDDDVYDKYSTFNFVASIGVSKETQLRALKILKVIVKGGGTGRPFFEHADHLMRDRWERLTAVISKSTRFSIQERKPLHCTFFDETRPPNPPFAWLKCNREEDVDCQAVLQQQGNIRGRPGSLFDDSTSYTRLSLTSPEDQFDLLLKRIKALVDQENGYIETVKSSNGSPFYNRKGLYM